VADRYQAEGAEAEFQPGSRNRVLRNLPGIRSVREMQNRESIALVAATQQAIDATARDQRFTSADVRRLHRSWLGEIYSLAGAYRTVNMSKDGFPFAAASQIDRLMGQLDDGALKTFTPCIFSEHDRQAEALAVVHAELTLIHPFRDGNGRCARMLATLMGLQAGLPPLDFSGVRGTERQRYVAAIHKALEREYEPMIAVFERVIDRTLRAEAR